MRITAIEARVVGVPVHREMVDAIRHFNRMDLILATVHTDAGMVGTGFTYSIIPHGAAEIARLVQRDIAELLDGADALAHEVNWQTVWRRLDWIGRGGIAVLALAAVDIALWDLKAQAFAQPLWRLLGGAPRPVPVYNTDGGWLNHSLEQLRRETEAIVAAGFSGTKIKVGKASAAEDCDRIAAVREVLGPGRTLMVDANERFTQAEAIRRARQWEAHDLFWFEEPLPAEDVASHAALKAHTTIPIAIGESLFTRQQFREYIASSGVSIVQADACRCGGITEWLKIAHLAACHNIAISPHFVMELHLPLVAAAGNGLFVEYIPSLTPVLREPLHLIDGHFVPSDEPGLGIAWDPAALDRYTRAC